MIIALLVVGTGAVAVAARTGRIHTSLFAILTFAVAVLPKALTADTEAQYVGIATRTPTFYSYTAVAAALGAWVVFRNLYTGILGLGVWLPFVLLITYYWQKSWPNDGITRSGMLQICTGAAVFAISFTATRTGMITSKALSRVLMACVAAQGIAVLSDLASRPIYTSHVAAVDGSEGRIVGFTSHAEVLAQVIVICMVGILASEPETKAEQVAQWVSVAMCLSIIALTSGRTAFIATLFTLVVYALLRPSSTGPRTRGVLIAIAVVVSLFAAGSFITRFEHDPSGGARNYLTNVALTAIHHMPPSGLGLNQYVNVVGSYDPVVASGVPVHSVYLLMVAETGFVAGFLFWLPLLVIALMAWRNRKRAGSVGGAARIAIASIPAILLISYEGWSLPSTQIFEVFAIVYGGLFGLISTRAERPEQKRFDAHPTASDACTVSRHEPVLVLTGVDDVADGR